MEEYNIRYVPPPTRGVAQTAEALALTKSKVMHPIDLSNYGWKGKLYFSNAKRQFRTPESRNVFADLYSQVFGHENRYLTQKSNKYFKETPLTAFNDLKGNIQDIANYDIPTGVHKYVTTVVAKKVAEKIAFELKSKVPGYQELMNKWKTHLQRKKELTALGGKDKVPLLPSGDVDWANARISKITQKLVEKATSYEDTAKIILDELYSTPGALDILQIQVLALAMRRAYPKGLIGVGAAMSIPVLLVSGLMGVPSIITSLMFISPRFAAESLLAIAKAKNKVFTMLEAGGVSKTEGARRMLRDATNFTGEQVRGQVKGVKDATKGRVEGLKGRVKGVRVPSPAIPSLVRYAEEKEKPENIPFVDTRNIPFVDTRPNTQSRGR
jgi:hypothetical protein